MSTLATIFSRLQTDLKTDTNNRIWSVETKNNAINDAYTYIQSEGNYQWPENQSTYDVTTTAGTQEYSLPSDYIILEKAIYDTIELDKVSKAWAVTMGTDGRSTPTSYYIYGNKIGFYPVPDGTYTVNLLYGKSLPTITDSVDSDFPQQFDGAISAYAAYLLNNQIPVRQATAQQYLIKAEQLLNTMKVSYLFQDLNTKFSYQRTGYGYRDDAIY